ncbi:MAG: DnaJ domain-containing protein, partial [Myxococcota bacterium]
RDGTVVGASSPAPADSLGRIAITAGLVTSTQLGDALRIATVDANRSQLEVLAEVARLSAQQVVSLKRRALAYRALRIFALEDATFVLDDRPTLALGHDLAPLSARWIIYHGLKTFYSEERLGAEMAKALGTGFRLAPQSHTFLDEYGLSADARSCVAAIEHEPRTVAELAELPRMTAKTATALIYALLASDALIAAGHSGDRPTSITSNDLGPPLAAGATTPDGASPVRRFTHQGVTRIPTEHPVAPSPADTQPDSPSVAGAATSPRRHTRRRTQPEPVPEAVAGRDGSRKVTLRAKRSSGRIARRRVSDPERAARVRALIADKQSVVEQSGDYFALLGVARGAGDAAVRKAYFALTMQLHPDKLSAAGITDKDQLATAHRVCAEINQAYAVLTHRARRAEYEATLDAGGAEAVRRRDDEAEDMARRLIEAEQAFRRGEMAARRNQWPQALAEFERAVELNPDDAEHHALLAWARWCEASDKPSVLDAVKKRLAKAISMSPRSVAGHFYRGRVAADSGDHSLAVDYFNRVLEIEPNHNEAALNLRLIKSRMGRKGEGRGLFGRSKKSR